MHLLAIMMLAGTVSATITTGRPMAQATARKAEKETAKPVAAGQAVPPLEETALKRLAQWDANLRTMQTGFTQEIVFGDTGMSTNIEGTAYYKKPNFLRIDHTSPSAQIVVTDRETISIYKPGDSQVVKTDWKTWIEQQGGTFSGITNFGYYGDLIKEHNVKVTEKDGLVLITLTPKKNKTSYNLTIMLDKTDFFPREVDVNLGETKVITKLKNTKINDTIPEAIFKWTPPPGTEVINF